VSTQGYPRVLVIEDDLDVSVLLGSHLKRLGCEVVAEATGEAGVLTARGRAPDVAFVDVNLPGIDGLEVLRELRTDPRTRCCRLVVTSVLDAQDLRDMGADAILPKPFSRHDVARVLTSLDSGRPQL
jgi:CheY-like chemotaxis protein